MTEPMGTSMARQRFSRVMLGAFAASALILSVVGVHGVMSKYQPDTKTLPRHHLIE